MHHKAFNIEASESQPGRWRATVIHPDGTLVHNGKQVESCQTRDYPNSESALEAARLDIDFTRIKRYFER